MKEPLTIDDIQIVKYYDEGSLHIGDIVIDKFTFDEAQEVKKQILDGLKALEFYNKINIGYPYITPQNLFDAFEENQKLKEEIQMLEQSWTPLNEEYENLKAENEELKYKFEASKKAYTEEEKELRELKDRHNDCIPILLERDVIQQENQILKETIKGLKTELIRRTQPISYNEDLLQENQKLYEKFRKDEIETVKLRDLVTKLKADLEQCDSFYTDLSKQWKEEVKAHNKSKAEIEEFEEKKNLILDGQKALEELPKYVKALAETNALYENRKLEVSYLTEENQKLKERLKEKEELLDWTINYGEYVIYGLRTEIEELKQLKIEFQSFVKNDYINVYLSPELKMKLVRLEK